MILATEAVILRKRFLRVRTFEKFKNNENESRWNSPYTLHWWKTNVRLPKLLKIIILHGYYKVDILPHSLLTQEDVASNRNIMVTFLMVR